MNNKNTENLREPREDGTLLPPPPRNQETGRLPSPVPTPESQKQELAWRETILFWNRSDYRWSLIDHVPCLLGLIWNEENIGPLESLRALPDESRIYFVEDETSKAFYAANIINFRTIFRTRTSRHGRRFSAPELSSHHLNDPQGITQESFLFGRFLRQILRSTKISCTAFIFALKLTQKFLRQRRLQLQQGFQPLYANTYDPGDNQFRLFVTTVLIADKYTEDHPYTNNAWASISGVPIQEINFMERAFLDTIHHQLYVSESEFREWTKILQNLCSWTVYNRLPSNSNSELLRDVHQSNNGAIPIQRNNSSHGHRVENKSISFWSRFKF